MYRLLLAIIVLHAAAQSLDGNWSQPMTILRQAVDNSPAVVVGSNLDVNGDGLPDIVIQFHDGGGASLATYLNTGKGYCVAFENAVAAKNRANDYGIADIPNCKDVSSISMHDPKEDTRVTKFLASIDLAEYAPAFAEHKVDFETLLLLTDDQLKEIGIRAVGARARIMAKQRSIVNSQPAKGSNYTMP
jgi:hypothetical protein